jgi:hypothetical protein
MYHNPGDVHNRVGYNLEQVRSIIEVQFVTLLHVTVYIFA